MDKIVFVFMQPCMFFLSLGRLAAKIARKDSLALKLSLRPDRDELIARNIIRVVSDKEQQETKEAIGAKLIRYVCDEIRCAR